LKQAPEIITFDQLAGELRELCPSMADWTPIFEEWETISLEELDEMIELYGQNVQWLKDFPCGLIARGFYVDVARHFADGKGKAKSVGAAHCSMLQGEPVQHTVNICRVPEGLFMVDLQTKKRWPVTLGEDEYYDVEI